MTTEKQQKAAVHVSASHDFRGRQEIHVKIRRDSPKALLPKYGSDGAACFDLYSLTGGEVPPHGSANFSTGLCAEIPSGFVMMVYSRSGHGFKNGIRLVNGTGIIDSDYRGVIAVGLRNDSDKPYTVKAGERIAQAMIIKCNPCIFHEAEELSDTARGTGGFGSTGKQ